MLAKTNEKDVIDQLLDQIDFHGMTAEELAGENGLLKKLTSRLMQTSEASMRTANEPYGSFCKEIIN